MSFNNIIDLMKTHPFLGYGLLILFISVFVLNQLAQVIPVLMSIKAKILIPLANIFKFKKLQEAAIKSDIQGTVNYALAPLSKEITDQKIKPLEIEWVEDLPIEKFIKEDKILVRIKPLKDQDDNILSVTQPYLESVLLPHSSLLIADVQKKSIVYFTTKMVIGNNNRLLAKFHDRYYLPDCKKYELLEGYFTKIDQIYRRGLFFSIVISAIEFASEKNRFKKSNLSSDFGQILDHLLAFIESLSKPDSANPTNVSLWNYRGVSISYGLLLVAMPQKALIGDIKPYITRATEHLKVSDILFVAFSHQERNFGNEVARAIEKALPVKLMDELTSRYDYRGENDGEVKIYIKEPNKI